MMIGCKKELEQENARLKRMYANVQLRYDVLREAMAKNGKACQTFDINECCYHYKRKLSVENDLIAEHLAGLASASRQGFWTVLSLLTQGERLWLEP